MRSLGTLILLNHGASQSMELARASRSDLAESGELSETAGLKLKA